MFRKTSLESFDSTKTNGIITTKEYYDYLCKIIMIGPSNSGKSSILHRYINKEWRILKSLTIGVEFVSKIVTIGDIDNDNDNDSNIKIKLQIWDTAGQERFRSLTRSYYRGSAGVILTFDITSRESFQQLDEFMVDIKNLTELSVSVILVANKIDLINDNNNNNNIVTKDEINFFIEKFEKELNIIIPVIYTSALSNTNIDELFNKLSCSILTKIELGYLNPESVNSGVQYGNLTYDLSLLSLNNRDLLNNSSKQNAINKLKRKQSLTLDLVNGNNNNYNNNKYNQNGENNNGFNNDNNNNGWFTCCNIQ